jgi:hypothetical protein
MSERGFTLPTDTAIFSTPSHAKEVWNSALKKHNFRGFEVLMWRWSPHLLKLWKDEEVAGYHGSIGGADHDLTAHSLTRLMLPTPVLINKYDLKKECKYLLIHDSEMREQKTWRSILINRKKLGEIRIENGPYIGSLSNTVHGVLKLREYGINAAITLDLFHLKKEMESRGIDLSMEDYWADMLQKVDYLMTLKDINKKAVPIHFHGPFGTRRADSLDIAQISMRMWKGLSCRLDERPESTFGFEAQSEGWAAIFSTRKWRMQQAARNEQIIETTSEAGLI